MSVLMLPRETIGPSHASSYARCAAESANPRLWKGLVGAWVPLLGVTGSALRDVSGQGNHGTLSNMDPGTDWVTWKDGSALYFPDVTDNVYVEHMSSACSRSSVGIIWLAYPHDITTDSYMGSSVQPVANKRAFLLGYQDGYWNCYNDGAYPTGTAADTQVSATLNKWQMITYTSNGTWLRGYHNRDKEIDVVADLTPAATITSYRIGSAGDETGGANMTLGMFLWYARALCDSDIYCLYEDPFAPFRLAPMYFAQAVAGGGGAMLLLNKPNLNANTQFLNGGTM